MMGIVHPPQRLFAETKITSLIAWSRKFLEIMHAGFKHKPFIREERTTIVGDLKLLLGPGAL